MQQRKMTAKRFREERAKTIASIRNAYKEKLESFKFVFNGRFYEMFHEFDDSHSLFVRMPTEFIGFFNSADEMLDHLKS